MAPQKSDHFNGKQFFNPDAAQARGILEVFRWKLRARPEPWPPSSNPPIPSWAPLPAGTGQTRISLINHSTVLIETPQGNVLTDPIWSERASPFRFAGPARKHAPGIPFHLLPPVHTLLLSHNHYDHLDLPTIRRLAQRDRPRCIVPLGVGPLLRANGMSEVTELDWWEESKAGQVRVTCVPAQHFSARGLTDRNRTLWSGFVSHFSDGPIFFAGDTGFGPHFAEIRRRLGPPRLSLLPIGAYKPQWFMGPVHMSPASAVEAHRILESQISVATHFGTFQLADDGPADPPIDLRAALERSAPLPPFVILRNGESLTLVTPPG